MLVQAMLHMKIGKDNFENYISLQTIDNLNKLHTQIINKLSQRRLFCNEKCLFEMRVIVENIIRKNNEYFLANISGILWAILDKIDEEIVTGFSGNLECSDTKHDIWRVLKYLSRYNENIYK